MKCTFYLKILQSLFLYMGILEMTSTAKSGRTRAGKDCYKFKNFRYLYMLCMPRYISQKHEKPLQL